MFNFIVGGDWEKIRSEKDAEQFLMQLKNAGYDGVEWCNFQFSDSPVSLEALKESMDRLELKSCGLHFHFNGFDSLSEDCAQAVRRCRVLGCDQLIFAYSLPSAFDISPDDKGHYTPEQIDAWAVHVQKILDAMKTACSAADIRVLYHNHAAELLTGCDGRYFLDMIHPDGQEFDVYWIAKGLDGKVSTALDFVRKHQTDARILHMKDGLNGSVFPGEMCGWGKGTYPLQDIADCAKELGLEWIVVENDAPYNFGTDGLTDALESADYMKKHIRL